MKTVQQIRSQAQRLWDSGRVLRAVLGVEGLFPLEIPLGRPTARELLDGFAAVASWKETIEAHCACTAGTGYRIEYEEINHRLLGHQRLPVRVVFDSAAALVGHLGKGGELARFAGLAREIRLRQPALGTWIEGQPMQVLDHATKWPRLLAVLEFLQAHPRPNLYLRELLIPGVDSKFIEGERRILTELLDRVLPPEAVDDAVTGLVQNGFERRFGLRYDEPLIRLRLLDPAAARAFGGLDDLSIPLGRFRTLDPPCPRVFITENKINGLSFPQAADSLVIFGLGYGIAQLAEAPWLREREVHYWGDIDTHGLAILSRLRSHLPQTRSFLMDRPTLLACREAWVEEPEAKRFTGSLDHLTEAELGLYRDLVDNRHAQSVRLEQERIPFDRVLTAVAEIIRHAP